MGKRVASCALGSVVLLLATAGCVHAAERTIVARYGPIDLAPAELKWGVTRLSAPHVRGFIERMRARVVDEHGHPIAIDRVMLHHAVFRKRIRPTYDRNCGSKRTTEPFYATGEEDERLRLPPGYGYPVSPHDRWRVRWMLMNHEDIAHRVYVSYSMRISTSRRTHRVYPLWLRVVRCGETPYFDVPGDGGPGSTFLKSESWIVPRSGRIVAAGGHLHGGALSLTLTEPGCASRALVSVRPLYGGAAGAASGNGPVSVTPFVSAFGIPVAAGEVLGLTAVYDDSAFRPDVMGSMHAYVAPGAVGASACAPIAPPPG